MILIIGVDGLLGNYLFKELSKYFQVLGTSRKKNSFNVFQFDILNPLSDLKIEWKKIDAVIISAACSKVDFCELYPDYSNEVNFIATTKIVKELKKINIPVILFSSEYVFDGEKGEYTELSKKCPQTNYGKQKKQLEDFVINYYDKSTIFRISKLATLKYKNSFLYKMVEEMKNNLNYTAAEDQFFTPINLEDCVAIILNAIQKNIFGIYNLCGIQNYSRYSLALKLKSNLRLDTNIKKCLISDINLNYKVPLNLTMNCEKIKNKFNIIPSELKLN